MTATERNDAEVDGGNELDRAIGVVQRAGYYVERAEVYRRRQDALAAAARVRPTDEATDEGLVVAEVTRRLDRLPFVRIVTAGGTPVLTGYVGPGEPFTSSAARPNDEATDEPVRLRIEGTWLVREVNYHTCGTGRDGHYGAHEPGCGLIPEVNLSTLDGWPAAARPADEDTRADLDGVIWHATGRHGVADAVLAEFTVTRRQA